MAWIRKEITIEAPADTVWDALSDFGALHERLVPGFVVDSQLEDDVRIITFFNGFVAHERLVSVDEGARRLAYSVIEGPLGASHHQAVAQVIDAGDGRTNFVWETDVLPDALALPVSELMARGIDVIKTTMEAAVERV